jgi:hypothetical protein
MRTPTLRVAGAAVIAVTLAACSGSGTGHHSSGSPAGARRTGASSSAGASHTGASSAAAQPDAPTRAAITAAYTTFFSSNSSLAQSMAVLQHGAAFRATLEAEGNSGYAQNSSATVGAISLVAPDVADVSFVVHSTISLPYMGKAVREDGRWKVAAETFCRLLTLEGTAPHACTDPAIVGLPA